MLDFSPTCAIMPFSSLFQKARTLRGTSFGSKKMEKHGQKRRDSHDFHPFPCKNGYENSLSAYSELASRWRMACRATEPFTFSLSLTTEGVMSRACAKPPVLGIERGSDGSKNP